MNVVSHVHSPVFIDPADNFHPYECHGIGVCVHCDRLPTKEHDPATCALCDPEYDYAPNPFRKDSNTDMKL